jgi:hypothetical protein
MNLLPKIWRSCRSHFPTSQTRDRDLRSLMLARFSHQAKPFLQAAGRAGSQAKVLKYVLEVCRIRRGAPPLVRLNRPLPLQIVSLPLGHSKPFLCHLHSLLAHAASLSMPHARWSGRCL